MVNLSCTTHGTGILMNVGLNGLFNRVFLQLTGRLVEAVDAGRKKRLGSRGMTAQTNLPLPLALSDPLMSGP